MCASSNYIRASELHSEYTRLVFGYAEETNEDVVADRLREIRDALAQLNYAICDECLGLVDFDAFSHHCDCMEDFLNECLGLTEDDCDVIADCDSPALRRENL